MSRKTSLGASVLLIALLNSMTLTAQISHGGSPVSKSALKTLLPPAPQVVMPVFNVDSMLMEDAVNDANKIGPWRFGYNHTVSYDLDNSGTWSTLPNGDRVWRLSIKCKRALSINLEFSKFYIPDGAKVFVMNNIGEHIGAFTNKNNEGHGVLGVQPMSGSVITIEYVEPAIVSSRGVLEIGQITHGYRDIFGYSKGLGTSGSCNNNVVCPEGNPWANEIRSVAIITVGGNGICTGTLLNNCAEDGTPYFLTADHCLGGQSTWVFRFNWDSPTCASTTNGPTNQTVSGSSLLASSAGSDVALLQLNSTPPSSYGVYYSGWDNSGNSPSSQTAIHHPDGDVKKISFDTDPAGQATYGGAQCWRIFDWEDGTTEPGSSGSGLWDQNHRLIGQLYGGQASCSNNVNDYYGRFDVSWPLLQPYLGSCGSTLDGWDPNAPTVTLDAQLNSISGVPNNTCSNSFDPTITIRNGGTSTLTSFTLNWDVDGGSSSSQVWNGSLTSGNTVDVSLPSVSFGDGYHTFNVWVSSPNGGTDLNTSNDASSTDFSYGPNQLTLDLVLDRYGEETTWSVTQGAETYASGGPFVQEGSNGEYPQAPITLCIPDGCYDFSIFDSYGDGMCCDYGNGSYTLTDQLSNVLANGGSYGFAETTNFCVLSSCVNSFPQIEDFEGGNTGIWAQSTSDDLDWTVNSGETASDNTGPDGDHTSGNGNYIYTEVSGNGVGFPNKVAELTSVCLDLSSFSSASMTFWYHMYGANIGTLQIDVYNGSTWSNGVWTLSGNQGNSWSQAVVDLSTHIFSEVQIRIKATSGPSWNGDIAIDDIMINGSAGVLLSPRAFLEGPFNTSNGLMDDDLRVLGYLPTNEPYSSIFSHVGEGGSESINPTVLDVTGNNAIVDWVFVEARAKNDNTLVVNTRSALLQRDGDIVDLDGTSPLAMAIPGDDYFIAVRHRNHNAVMTSGTVTLSAATTVVDLTLPGTSTYGTNATKNEAGTMLMWMGNTNSDAVIKYTGGGNDRDLILTAIGGTVPTATVTGYRTEDCSMDGVVKYTGSVNDRDPILTNIGGVVPTATRTEQLP